MSQSLPSVAAALLQGGAQLADAGPRIEAADPGPRAFGAHGPGELGEVGREAYRLWQEAVQARVRETAAHSARLSEAGEMVARAASGYQDVDEDVRRRHATTVGDIDAPAVRTQPSGAHPGGAWIGGQ